MPHRPNSTFSRRAALTAAVALAAGAAAPAALAQAWPAKPIRIVVGFPAGSSTDTIARVLAEHMRGKPGQPVVVENRPGANGVIGVSEAARAPADGYTLLVTNSSSITVNHQVYKKISYLPERDFTPVTMVPMAPATVSASLRACSTAALSAEVRSTFCCWSERRKRIESAWLIPFATAMSMTSPVLLTSWRVTVKVFVTR